MTFDADKHVGHPSFCKEDPEPSSTGIEKWPEIMNEQEAGVRWKGWGDSNGIMTKIENAASTSVPDYIYMSGGLIMWMELKIRYNDRYIYGPPYQMAYAIRISHHINPWQHHYIVYRESTNTFEVFTERAARANAAGDCATPWREHDPGRRLVAGAGV